MSKVVILGDKLNLADITFNKNDDIIVIGNENSQIPMSIVKKLFESKVRFEVVDNPSVTSIAFLLGRLSDKEKITDIYTDNAELKTLFQAVPKKAVRSAKPKTVKAETVKEEVKDKAPEPKEEKPKKERSKKDVISGNMNPPEPVKTKSIKEKSGKKAPKAKNTLSADAIPVYTTKDYKHVKEGDVKKILKAAGYDEKYVSPIMDALSIATDVSLDMYVRAKVALVEEDKDVIIKLGDLMKEKLK